MGFVLMLFVLASCQPTLVTPDPGKGKVAYGVFTERGLSNVPMNGVIKVSKTTQFFFGHQNGNKVTGISLQLYAPNIKLPDGTPSTSHAFAQLIIERLSEYR